MFDDSTIINDIVTIGESMGLEVDADDIVELFEDRSIELTSEEIEHLQNEQENNWLMTLRRKKRIRKISQLQ